MPELETAVHDRIQSLCAQGDSLLDDGDFDKALESFWSAWDILPEPQTSWEAATWILAAIGDTNFQAGDFEAGRDNLAMAMHCPDAIGNPFLHLRLGQCLFNLGDTERAADELSRAFVIEGPGLFENEDPRYLKFIKARLKEPPGGW